MSQPWTALFSITGQAVLEMNLAGVTQSLADHPPAAEVNSIMWILTHMVGARRWFLRDAFNASFGPAPTGPMTLEKIKAGMAETQAAMTEAFEAVADWNELRTHPFTRTPAPLDQIAGAFFMHESYHLGQIGMARKLLGLPGVLKLPPTVEL